MKAAAEEIEKIRSDRRKISALCGNDPYLLINRYITRAQNRDQENPPYRQTNKAKQIPAGN